MQDNNSDPSVKFRFGNFNQCRELRGVPAARVYVDEGEGEFWLWMSYNDIRKNIKRFGRHDGLVTALAAYKNNNDGGC